MTPVVGQVYQYQGCAKFSGRLVRVTGFEDGLARIEVITKSGKPTGTTAGVSPGWLAAPGESSESKLHDLTMRKQAEKISEQVITSFGIADADDAAQGEFDFFEEAGDA